jgi:hypothetical protein
MRVRTSGISCALARDRAADARDLEADEPDAELASLHSILIVPLPNRMLAGEDRLAAAADRERLGFVVPVSKPRSERDQIRRVR